jgi:hypothetical protein
MLHPLKQDRQRSWACLGAQGGGGGWGLKAEGMALGVDNPLRSSEQQLDQEKLQNKRQAQVGMVR